MMNGCWIFLSANPARLKIKDPETSPTNRWLLERAGQVAATVLLEGSSPRQAVSLRVPKRIRCCRTQRR